MITTLAMDIVRFSMIASLMIGVGCIIRFLGLRRLPKVVFVIIWSLIAIRLLVPIHLPVGWDMMEVLNDRNGFSREQQVEHDILQRADDSLAQEALPSPLGEMPLPVGLIETHFLDLSPSDEVIRIFSYVWILGVVLLGGFLALNHLRFRKKQKKATPITNPFVLEWQREHRLRRPVQICTLSASKKALSPLTYGVFRPMILLPQNIDLQDEDQISYILAHEYTHIKRFDYILKIVFTCALVLHWFNPLVWVMYILANRDIELACDEGVVKWFGENRKASYALTLLNMTEDYLLSTSLYNGLSKNNIKERVEAILHKGKTSIIGAIFIVTLVGVSMIAFTTSAYSETLDLEGEDFVENERVIPPPPLSPEFLDNVEEAIEMLEVLYDSFPTGEEGEVHYPDDFGGVYFDDEGNLVRLQVPSEMDEESERFDSYHDSITSTREVEFSYNYLVWIMDMLDHYSISGRDMHSAVSWGLDVRENRVIVGLLDYHLENILAFRRNLLDSPALVFQQGEVVYIPHCEEIERELEEMNRRFPDGPVNP